MAFFKFRKNGDEPSATALKTESVEEMRRRAKHRLLGAAVLVLLGVVGFPLLFDKQPRPIPVDIVIEIPDKNKVKPLSIPLPVVSAASAVASAGLSQVEEKVAETPIPASSQETKAVTELEPKAAEKLTENPGEKAPLRVNEAPRWLRPRTGAASG
jgi:DedD protein